MGRGEHYEQALVPEHLTRLTIENLPLDEAFYISPGERDDYEPPAVFVSPDRHLKMRCDYAIDPDDDSPVSPIGLVGAMRVVLIDSDKNTIKDHYIADLRFLEYHSLVDADEMQGSILDQEAYMLFVEALEESVQFDAFIALDEDYEFDVDEKIPGGAFYGTPDLHPYLKLLRKRSNKLMKMFLEHQAKSTVETKEVAAEKAAEPEQPTRQTTESGVKSASDMPQ